MNKIHDYPPEEGEPSFVPDTDLKRPPINSTGMITYERHRSNQKISMSRPIKIVHVRPYSFSFFFTDNRSAKSSLVADVYYHRKDALPIRWAIPHGENHANPWTITNVFWQSKYNLRFQPRKPKQAEIF